VFVTAYDQYALDAFESAAVDYLVKPFRDDRFREALRRARRLAQADGLARLHQQLVALVQSGAAAVASPAPPPAPRYLERIAVQTRGRVQVVPVERIEYVTASGPYVELHAADRRYIIRESMQHLEEQLDPNRFLRIHRSAIVRLDLIESLIRSEGSEYHVVMKSGVRLRVGRSRREALEQRLGGIR
jgi:two-component system LytT family response regulator